MKAVIAGRYVDTEAIKWVRCACHTPEHQLILSYYKDEEQPGRMLTIQVHLTKHGFWRRFWYGLRYIFGFQSKYGAFTEMVIDEIEALEIEDYLHGFRTDPKLEVL